MKNIFKIATISALVMLSANAMAEDANQDFTWTGTVPAADAGGGIKIIDVSSSGTFATGTFTLTKTGDINEFAGVFDIASASTLSFDVVTDDVNEDHVDYYYTLTTIMLFDSYHPAGQPTFRGVDIMANGTPMQKDVKSTTAATASTDLTLTGNGQFYYGDETIFQATLLITDQAI